MFIKVTTSGPRRYVQIVESYRDEAGRVKKRTVATLGRADQISGELDSVIDGLLKVTGRKPLSAAGTDSPAVFESARALGNVWALTELWKELGFLELRRVFGHTRHTTDVEALIRIMVLNRLCDPDSKLGVLRWLKTVALPDIDVPGVTHQQLLRTMEALIDHQDAVDAALSGLLRPMVDQDLSVVFYNMTTIRAEALTTQPDDVRKFGMAKEGLMARFPHIRRLVLVADRGLLSLDNLKALQAIKLSKDQVLEFILAVPRSVQRIHGRSRLEQLAIGDGTRP